MTGERTPLHEVFFLVDTDGNVLFEDAGATATYIPDSRARWEAIWAAREALAEIAHSHPVGPLAFSSEDETTMLALESALGRDVVFSVVAPDGMIRRQRGADAVVDVEPSWANRLRVASGMQPKQ